MLDLTNPKVRKALAWGLGAIVLLSVAGVLAPPETVQLLSALFGAAFGG
ncbi:hypothetical protein [Luteimonas saliphila]|nr:hypothetical protein [Luteimonas saliphila]